MKSPRLIGAALAAVLMVASVAGATLAAAPSTAPGQNKLLCFSDGDATCTQPSKGAKGTAVLTVNSLPATAAVYYFGYNDSIYGVALSSVTQLSFNFSGTPNAGSPRFSVPIDENDDGYTEAFAFVGAALCNNGAGLVDAINDPTCNVNYLGLDYANWATFAAAFPAAEVSLTDNYVFVVADDIGSWTVGNVTIGKSGK